MTMQKGWTLKYHSKRDIEERLAFIKIYVEKLKENPDEIFRQQVRLVNSFLKAAKNYPLTKEAYLKIKGELRTKERS
ncbi:hypothetical protein [Thermococcus barophilus]|uniref:Transposase n=1 Tax=Thermococcus barophilus TaxID=55802 RepID=A0A0S1XCG0_THEBA|nr:hypothetical protein [Thermococcus barophilus]ALM75482.1 hypothetical protein TBCH5v1_1569 [Thermococcus barophilus]